MAQKLDSSELIMIDFQYVFFTHRNAENNYLWPTCVRSYQSDLAMS